jgi:uncharacterized iron-regulated membrane protein
MESFVSLLITIIIVIIIVGFLLYIARRAINAFVPDAKLQEMVWIVLLLLTFLMLIGLFFSGGFSHLRFPLR